MSNEEVYKEVDALLSKAHSLCESADDIHLVAGFLTDTDEVLIAFAGRVVEQAYLIGILLAKALDGYSADKNGKTFGILLSQVLQGLENDRSGEGVER